MNYKCAPLILSGLILNLTGCAISSGLQTYDIPTQGDYTTEQGVNLSVVQLTQENIVTVGTSLPQIDSKLSELFTIRHQEYRLNPYDVISIQLWAYPQITPPQLESVNPASSGYTIDNNGNIYLPLIGKVHATGKTVAELTSILRSQFAHYLKIPDVIVRILSYEGQHYSVNGQVMRSGQYTLSNQPISLYTAIGVAGGINPETADSTSIQLIRQGKTYNINTLAIEKQGYS